MYCIDINEQAKFCETWSIIAGLPQKKTKII